MRAWLFVGLAACGAGAPVAEDDLAARGGSRGGRGGDDLEDLEEDLEDALDALDALEARVAAQGAELTAARAEAARATAAAAGAQADAAALAGRLAEVEATQPVVVAYVSALATGDAGGGGLALADALWTSDPITGASVPRVDGVFAGLTDRPELGGAAWDGVVDASLRRLHTPTRSEAQELFSLIDTHGRTLQDQGGQLGEAAAALAALDERTSAGDAALGAEDRRLKAELEAQSFRIGDALAQCGFVRDESSAGLRLLGGALDEAEVALAALAERTSAGDAALGTEDRRLKAELEAQGFRIGDALAQCGWVRDESLRLAGEDEALWGEVVRVERAMGERVDEVKDWVCRDPDLAGEKSLYCGSTSHL